MNEMWIAWQLVGMRVLAAAALGLLAACAAVPTHQGAAIVQSFPECSKPSSRAFLAEDGRALVVHCHDESAQAWSHGQPAVKKPGKVALCDLAREG